MDRPNVNFSFLEGLNKNLKEEYEDDFNLFDTGSCGIHTVSNAFKEAFKK